MKKFASILGIIVSVLIIAVGFMILSGDVSFANYSGNTASNTSFGGDFYTYSYRATRYAANNVHELGNFAEGAMALLCFVFGGMTFVFSLISLGSAINEDKQTALLERIARTSEASAAQGATLDKLLAQAEAIAAKMPPAKEPAPAEEAAKPHSAEPENTGWVCRVCYTKNPSQADTCASCGEAKPARMRRHSAPGSAENNPQA